MWMRYHCPGSRLQREMKSPARKRVRLLEREERGLLGHGPSLLARNPGNRGESPSPTHSWRTHFEHKGSRLRDKGTWVA